ncbi:hypothetical protein CO671_14890 [Rhizobium sp. M10]|nr:hypothetical protein CO671_14890 [Rhizobium sp. M10]
MTLQALRLPEADLSPDRREHAPTRAVCGETGEIIMTDGPAVILALPVSAACGRAFTVVA